MATAYTTQSTTLEDLAIRNMHDKVEAAQSTTTALTSDAMAFAASAASPQPSPRINLPPPPNPPFTFPAQPSSSAPSSFSRATGRRPQSAIEIYTQGSNYGLEPHYEPRRSPAPAGLSFNGSALNPETGNRRPRPLTLPDFSFNPGASSPSEQPQISPSLGPASPRMIPPGGHMGHRRGGSEFVGGKPKTGEAITVMSTSPTKGDAGFPSPSLTPRTHRRGHSHKRSGAISSHDLSKILQASPNPSSRGSSAPTSPADFSDSHRGFPSATVQSVVVPTDSVANDSTAAESEKQEKNYDASEESGQSTPQPSPKPATRARVGFSDTLEFIPRPLSLVSTDTTSTARPGHSLSGSISSIASITNCTTVERDQGSILGSPVSQTHGSPRPSTAGAVLERSASLHATVDGMSVPRRRNSIPVLSDLAQNDVFTSSLPTPTKTPKRWSFFGFDSFAATGSPTKARPVSSSSSDTAIKGAAETAVVFDDDDDAFDSDSSEEGVRVEEKKKPSKKKKRRVKTWAGSILSRKSKSRTQKSKARSRSRTPPVFRPVQDEVREDEMSDKSQQSARDAAGITRNHAASDTEITAPRRRHVPDESPFPMIDLDAALGPFNTPSRDPQWDEAQRAGVQPKRALHSAAGLRGFSGPGMHYHRRAESAPEMPPFEAGRFSIHRFGSSSTMADVFEEDEEEEEKPKRLGKQNATCETGEADSTNNSDNHDSDEADSTPTQEQDSVAIIPTRYEETKPVTAAQSSTQVRSEKSFTSLHDEVIVEGEAFTYPPKKESILTVPSPELPDPPVSSSARQDFNAHGPPDAASIILPGPPGMPISPYNMSHTSSFPSPRSPMSYDAHRISTTPSSIADENTFHSLLMGEPGPEVVRLSVDVPSLTSTNSTMTRESNFIAGVRPRNMPFHDQRPASFTSTAFGRRRSSLASLSRLISSAHGERSKLSVEVPLENEADKKAKSSKSKRLTKMMQFWKPKGSNGS
ncbi:hypothetical protein F5Y18DRAFT_140856 [Xylariaceae sp. FL1019]|nr:hypothetical protein F5Y18DRAFT_140856 [Xylariaceae sp. FL1019]